MIKIKNLTVDIPSSEGSKRILHQLSFEIPPHSIFGLIGESGSGKTMTSLAMMGLLKLKIPSVRIQGEILYRGVDLLKLSDLDFHEIRGKKMSIIFQNPYSYFNPAIKIRNQFDEILAPLHPSKVIEILKSVQLRDENRILSSYPHQLSGGQLQRLMIAISLLHQPEVLIADEPTTALDPSLRMGVINLLKGLKEKNNLTLFIISHDISAISHICDHIAVMYRGEIVEMNNAKHLLKSPQHPYTQRLFSEHALYQGSHGLSCP